MSKAQTIAIKCIKAVREMQEEHYQKQRFCKQHNMELDAIKHSEIERELGRVCSMLQDEFGTNWIGIDKD